MFVIVVVVVLAVMVLVVWSSSWSCSSSPQAKDEEEVKKQELHECNADDPTSSPNAILGNIANTPIQALQQVPLLPFLLIKLHLQNDLNPDAFSQNGYGWFDDV